MIGNLTKVLYLRCGAEGRAAGAGEEAPKISGTDGSREGNHGVGGVHEASRFGEGTGGAPKGRPGAVPYSEGAF